MEEVDEKPEKEEPCIYSVRGRQILQFSGAPIAQREYGRRICTAIRCRAGHQRNQLADALFEQHQIRADHRIQIQQQMIELLLRLLLASRANELL